jgi:succinate-semialdehyde dehydrogenase/glutarate-semialdehyde dehydrogenase
VQSTDGDFDVGALFSAGQMGIVEQHVADAVAKGATVLVGGRRNPHLAGLYFEPTVLVNVNHSMLIMNEETFGPVMPIMRVRDEDEAIRMANDSVFGLGANVWTNDINKGLEIAKLINSGSVSINDMTITFGIPEAPFGGVKNSGIGRVNGEIGLKGYCHIQPVIVDRFGGQMSANKYPTDSQKARDMQNVINSIWGGQLGG